MVSLILAYGGFLTAEHFGVSGVLATVTAGLMLSFELEKQNREQTRNYLRGFWENINPVVLSILFIVMGLEVQKLIQLSEWWAMLVIFVLSLISREIILLISYKTIPNLRERFKFTDVHIMTWAGIKGTMSVALLLMFKDQYANQADMIISLAIGAIIISMVVQSLSIYPLSKRS
ncbi:cation:proton antiporter domain-containing protein [Piscibacillus salipiscarius]|nr:cation:proton antiporter [Piscibacillus salipiscarius]